MDINNVSGEKLIIDGVLIATGNLLSGITDTNSLSHIPLTIYVSNMKADIRLILGNDFVNHFVEAINVSKKLMILKNGVEIPLVFGEKNIASLDVVSVGKHIIPPLSKIRVPARIATLQAEEQNPTLSDTVSEQLTSGDALFEPVLINNSEKEDEKLPVVNSSLLSIDGSSVAAVPSLINVTEDGNTSIVVENHTLSKCCLKDGSKLGTIESLDTIDRNTQLQAYKIYSLHVGSESESNINLDDPPPSITPLDWFVSPTQVESGDKLGEGDTVMPLTNNISVPHAWKDSSLPEEFESKLLEVLVANVDCFAVDPKSPNTTDVVEHKIDTGDHPPIYTHPYRVSPIVMSQQGKEIETMLSNGIITPSDSHLVISCSDGW